FCSELVEFVTRLSGGFRRRVHAMLEHLEPGSGISIIVDVQLPYHLTRKFHATEAARSYDVMVSHRKLIDVEVFIAVISDHGLQIAFRIARVPNAVSKPGSGDLQCSAANRGYQNLICMNPAK